MSWASVVKNALKRATTVPVAQRSTVSAILAQLEVDVENTIKLGGTDVQTKVGGIVVAAGKKLLEMAVQNIERGQ